MQKNNANKISSLGMVIWSLASVFFLYEFFIRALVGTVATDIIQDLHISADKFALIGTAYFIAYGFMQVPVGILIDKFGVRKTLIFGTSICVFSVFLFAYSTSLSLAIISRFLMGLGSAFAFICTLTIVSSWFPKKNYAFIIGLSQFIGTMGPILAGAPFAIYLAKHDNAWREVLNNIGFVGIALVILMFFIIKDKPNQNIVKISKPKKQQLTSLKVFIKNPQIWFIAFYTGMIYLAMPLLGVNWGVTYLKSCGFSSIVASKMISITWLGYAISCASMGALSDYIKRRNPILQLCAVIGIVVTILLIFMPSKSQLFYEIVFFLLGASAAGESVAFASISENADQSIRSTALGMNNTGITCFAVIPSLITGYLISLNSSPGVSDFSSSSFLPGLLIMLVFYFVAAFLAIFMIKETHSSLHSDELMSLA